MFSGFTRRFAAPKKFDLTTAQQSNESADTSPFTDAPRGGFAKQDQQFANNGIKQLSSDNTVDVVRGDARPIDLLLKEGIAPLSPDSRPVNILAHRRSSANSSGVSFTFRSSTAAFWGAFASQKSHYGRTPVMKNRFHIIAAQLDGRKYDVAGPSSEICTEEFEATVASAVKSSDIRGFAVCNVDPAKDESGRAVSATCHEFFVRASLSQEEQEKVESLLRNGSASMSSSCRSQ